LFDESDFLISRLMAGQAAVRPPSLLNQKIQNSNHAMNTLSSLFNHPRRLLTLICIVCIAMLAFGLYLQHGVGLEPCPMCIVQRYALVAVAVLAGITALASKKSLLISGSGLLVLFAGFGAFVAARQSFLQWYPPEIASCGRDFYGMIETFPLQRAIPMIFKGSGDCTKIDWTFLGLSIANWSFIGFVLIALAGVLLVLRRAGRR
jgi:protein dithiol:quinone oxidoreductase